MEKLKRTSKYVGKFYGNWKVVDIFVRSVQGIRCTYKRNANGNLAKSANPRSTQYTYILERITSDGKCDKRIAVSGNQMTAIAKGLLIPEVVADSYGKAKTDYRFR